MTDTLEAFNAREKKLPKWAQDELKALRERRKILEIANETLQCQINEYESRVIGDWPVIELEPYRRSSHGDRSRERSQLFNFQSRVHIHTGKNKNDYVSVAVVDGGIVELTSGHSSGLLVLPSASNSVRVISEDTFMSNRAARVVEWEKRVRVESAKVNEAKRALNIK